MSAGQGVVVATIDANTGGVSRAGAISRDGSRYQILIDGTVRGQAGSLDGAANRLAAALRNALPPQQDSNWGVLGSCVFRADVALAFGNRAGGGGDGGFSNACVADVASDYNRGANNLNRALEFAARLIARCCSDS
jgi:hypothetical protein